MKKRIVSIWLTLSILLSMIPLSVLTAFAQDKILYGDADGNGKIELLDVNLMERYKEGDNEAESEIHFTEADVNADGVIDDTDIDMVKNYLVGNLDSLKPTLHTISFVTDGGGEFEPIKAGDGYPYKGEIPVPAKDNYVFVNWIMGDGEVYYQLTEIVSEDIILTAVYEPVELREQLSITSFSLKDQPSDVSFTVTGNFESADEVESNITVMPKDGSEPVMVDVKDNEDGTFTVYAPDGFNAGASYELTLGDGLCFKDDDGIMDAMFRTVYFIIKKDTNSNLKYDPDMIFIQDTAEMRYNIGGQTVDVLESALLSNDESENNISGTFSMTGQKLNVGDIVCIYETTDPRERDYTENSFEGDAMAFIRIMDVSGSTYTFESLDEEDSQEVLAMPDSFPFKVDTLPDANGTVGVNDYDAYAMTMLGNKEEPEFEKDDFLTFYTVDFDKWSENTPVVYGQITKVEDSTIYYNIIKKEDIDNYMGLFVSQNVDSSEILDGLDEEELIEQVERQALNSGFAEEAANRMVDNALQTGEIQQKLLDAGFSQAEISQLNAARASGVGGRVKFTAEKPSVSAAILKDTHFKDGVGVALNVSVVLSFDQKLAGKTNSLKIELTAGFEQEIALGFDIDIDDRWEWYLFIPVLKEVNVSAAIDIENYTYMSVGAKVYTVSEDNAKKWKALSETTSTNPKIQNAIRQINKLTAKLKKLKAAAEETKAVLDEIEGYKEQLPAVYVDGVEYSVEQLEEALGAEDVSAAFDEVFSAQNETESKTGMEQLMNRYKEMLEQECDWVELINQPLISQTYWIAIAAVKVNLNFVVKANVNIQIGAEMEYQVGKRYSFWLHLLGKNSGSSEIDLIDERFAFQFYVMGTLGIKAGVKAEIAFGILSTDLASVGANVEFGAYLKLYGYFIYYFEDLRPANTSISKETEEMMGALYIDFGLYVTVKFKAQVLWNAFKYEPTLYDGEFPLLTAGVQENVYGFALEPDGDDVMYVWDDDANSTNGISMVLPETYRTMKRMNLVTGGKSQAAYEKEKFIVTFNDGRFSCINGTVYVDVPENTRYLSCEARIVWKSDKLTFSKYDIAITLPVVWTNMSEEELKEKFTATAAVGSETEGYTAVWSARYGRLDVFDLPTEAEILELIDYDSYNTEDGENLKYGEIGGYLEEATGQSLSNDKTWHFDIEPKQYTVTVRNVQKADGKTESRTFTAAFGESFDFSDLKNTGANNPEAMQFSTFRGLTDSEEDGEPVTSLTVDMAFAEKYGNNAVLYANYIDDTLTASFEFVGLGETKVEEVKFQRGATPYFENMRDYVISLAGRDTVDYDITPYPAPSETSVKYTVNCRITEDPKPLYKITFDSRGGSAVKEQNYPEGARILKPTDPVREGYTFDVWYYQEEGSGNTYWPHKDNWSYQFMGSRNRTYYAVWEANSYTVSFDTQESSISPPPEMSVKYEEDYGELPTLSHPERKFIGWFTQPVGGEKITADTQYIFADNTTLYAHWEMKKEVSADWIKSSKWSYTYNGSGQAYEFTVDAPDSALTSEDFIVTYKADTAGAGWTSVLPVNAGSYGVKLELANPNEDYLQNEVYLNAGMVIDKATPSFWNVNLYATNWVVSPSWGTSGDGEVSFNLYRGTYGSGSRIYVGSFPASADFTIPSEHRNQPGGFYLTCYVSSGANYTSGSSGEKYMQIDSMGNSMLRPPAKSAAASMLSAPVLYSAAPLAAAAEDTAEAAEVRTMTLSPEEIVANRGREFEITLSLDQAADIWGILAAVDYDTDALELLGYTCGDIFTETQFTVQNDLTAAPYKLLATLDEIGTTSAEGSFVSLRYRIRENAPEEATAISLAMLEAVGEKTAVPLAAGSDIPVVADDVAPVIGGIKDGETYFGDTVAKIADDNLASVTVNGEAVTVTDGKITLKPAEGEQLIVVADKAGNSVAVTVTVNEEKSADTPATGDSSRVSLLIALLFVSGGTLRILTCKYMRKRNRTF